MTGNTDTQRLFDATNGGLDIIIHYYPEAADCVGHRGRKFRIRAEKTPSASIKELNGVWIVTDFGGDGKAHNGIDVCMKEEGVTFPEAIRILQARYNITAEGLPAAAPKAAYNQRPATDDEKDGEWYFDQTELSETHLKEIFARYVYSRTTRNGTEQHRSWDDLRKVCDRYHLKALNSYTIIKDRKAHIYSAGADYPMFIYNYESWQKIYQPRHQDKSRRFMYHGQKPHDHINGLRQLKSAVEESFKPDDEHDEEKSRKSSKFDQIFLASGDRDALNLAALGHWPVWLNSETASLTRGQWVNLLGLAKRIINVPDIDETGLRKAHELNMQYLELYTIELPAELKQKKDWRGNPCKDLRDYLQHFNEYAFTDLVKVALPYKFWTEQWDVKSKRNFYEVNNTALYHFLTKQGFYRIKSQDAKEGYRFIKLSGHVVKRIEAKDIRDYINVFLIQQRADVELRNAFYRTNQLSESSLSNLPFIDIDFTDYEKDAQYLFFRNATWKVSAGKIDVFKPGEIKKYVWDNEVIPHDVTLLDPAFRYYQEQDHSRIQIHNRDCLFLQFLENTSKVHWKVEADGVVQYDADQKPTGIRKELTDDEKLEHELHLANKLYSLGYLLHRYKNPARPWAVWAMDHKIADESESHGGSGKSLAYLALTQFMPADQEILYTNILNGRDPKLTDNIHLFGDVTEHTDLIIINDAHQYINFQFFFEPLTGTMSCNPKHAQRFTLPFTKSPKFVFTSNYAVRKADPSTLRRILYTVFSDWYHHGPNDEYEDERSPFTEFGKNLFDDFNENEWNLFFNTMARGLQLYLELDAPIAAPAENIKRRTLKAAMGEEFKQWADVYFNPENEQLDKLLVKEDVKKHFIEHSGIKTNVTTQRFTSALMAWCNYYGYILNPEELTGPGTKRIIKKHEGVAKEMVYVQTKLAVENEDEITF